MVGVRRGDFASIIGLTAKTAAERIADAERRKQEGTNPSACGPRAAGWCRAVRACRRARGAVADDDDDL